MTLLKTVHTAILKIVHLHTIDLKSVPWFFFTVSYFFDQGRDEVSFQMFRETEGHPVFHEKESVILRTRDFQEHGESGKHAPEVWGPSPEGLR